MFIDGSNLFHATRELDRSLRLDLVKLRDLLAAGKDLIRAYYYGSALPDADERARKQTAFHHSLAYAGFKTVILPLRQRGGRYVEKGVDVALAVDLITLAFDRVYERAILVSGDADYVRAIQEAERKGVRVEVAFFDPPLCSGELRRSAHSFTSLNQLVDRVRRTRP